jgi:MFS family permease
MTARALFGISVLWVPLAFLFDGVTVLVLPIRLGGSATEVGLVSFAGLAFAAILQPLAGWLSDTFRSRVDRRLIAAGAAIPAIIGLWLLVGSFGVAIAMLGYVIVQGAATVIQAGQQTFIPEHVEGGARGRASGLKTAFDVGGAFVAFVVLGMLLSGGDPAPAAIATTIALLGATIAMLALVPRTVPSADRPGSRFEFRAGLGSLVAARFLFLFATFAVGRFLLLLVAERLGIPADRAADEAGGILAFLTLVTAGAALPFGSLADRIPRRALMAGGAVVATTGIALLVPAIGIAGLLAGGLLMSLGTAAFVTANWAETTSLVPASDAGRLMGLANLGTAVAAASGGLVGPLIDAAGMQSALVLTAMASAASIAPVILVADRPRRPAESPT